MDKFPKKENCVS